MLQCRAGTTPAITPRRPRPAHPSPPPAATANGAPAAAAPSCRLSPIPHTFEFPHRGSGLLWARSTGLKLWPGAMLLARAAAEANGSLLAALHPRLSSTQTPPAPPSAGAAAAEGISGGGGSAAAAAARWSGWEGRRVLELGCGLGLVSCAVAWLGGKVVATDGDADLLRVTARNIKHNTCGPGGAPLTRHPVRTARLWWGDEGDLRAALALFGQEDGSHCGGNGSSSSSSSGGSSSSSGGSRGATANALSSVATPTAAAAAAATAAAATPTTAAAASSTATPGQTPGQQKQTVVDCVLLSDCVYGSDPGLWEKLAATLSAVSGPDTLIVQAETRRIEGVLYDQYWESMEAAGFERRPLDSGVQQRLEADLVALGAPWPPGAVCSLWVLHKAQPPIAASVV